MAQVLNKRTASAEQLRNAVYVGRPTKWGNPFTHQTGSTLAEQRVETRDQAVDEFERNCQHLREDAKRELRGKDLVCWCAPARCHADILLKWANE